VILDLSAIFQGLKTKSNANGNDDVHIPDSMINFIETLQW